MPIRTITKLGAPILRAVAETTDPRRYGTAELTTLLRDMVETMIDAEGIGIAAPQVGVDAQVAIINHRDEPFAIINPTITKRSLRTELAEEGCLSVPGVFGTVRRSLKVSVRFTDESGTEQTVQASGLLARVFQHEIDHLNGVLFVDRVQRFTRGARP